MRASFLSSLELSTTRRLGSQKNTQQQTTMGFQLFVFVQRCWWLGLLGCAFVAVFVGAAINDVDVAGESDLLRLWRKMCINQQMADLSRSVVDELKKVSTLVAEESVRVDLEASEHVERYVHAVMALAVLHHPHTGRLCWLPDQPAAELLVRQSDTLSQVVAWSSMRSTDMVLNELHKLLIGELTPSLPPLDAPNVAQWVAPLLRLTMFFSSVRNARSFFKQIPPTVFFHYDSLVANFWMSSTLRLYEGTISEKRAFGNLKFFLSQRQWWSPWSTFDEHLNAIYYACSYVSAQRDRYLKEHMNKVLQAPEENQWQQLAVSHRWGRGKKMRQPFQWHRGHFPVAHGGDDDDDDDLDLDDDVEPEHTVISAVDVQPHAARIRKRKLRVAVLTQFWFKRHSVYRTLAGYAEALARTGNFELELLSLGAFQHDAVKVPFRRVKSFEHPSDHQKALDVLAYMRNEKKGTFRFDIAWFPDVGMSWPSIFLANKRVAPLMVSSVGHSVSSHGSLVDFFVSGDLTEEPIAMSGLSGEANGGKERRHPVWKRYSERLLLLPGAGVVHNHPHRLLNDTFLSTLLPRDRGDRRRLRPGPPVLNAAPQAERSRKREDVLRDAGAKAVLLDRGLMVIPGISSKASILTPPDSHIVPTVREPEAPLCDGTECSPPTVETEPLTPARLVISCPASAQKLNFPFLRLMGRILRSLQNVSVTLRIFTNVRENQPASLAVITRAVASALGITGRNAFALRKPHDTNVTGRGAGAGSTGHGASDHRLELFSLLEYDIYMKMCARAHFFVEPYHYGGCNTVIDAVYNAGKPIVTRRGRHWYNRIGSQILEHAGMSELVTEDDDEFIRCVTKMASDPLYLARMQRAVNQARPRLQAMLVTESGEIGEASAATPTAATALRDPLTIADWTTLSEKEYFPLALEFAVTLQRYTYSAATLQLDGFAVRQVGTRAAFQERVVARAPLLLRYWLRPWLRQELNQTELWLLVYGHQFMGRLQNASKQNVQ